MRIRWGLRPVMLVFAVLLFSLMMTLPIVAQQRQARPAGPAQPIPRRADGTVNLGSTEPNKGFFSGRQHWGYEEVLKDPKEGIPYQPWAKALREFRQGTLSKYDPEGFCLPPGGPRAMHTDQLHVIERFSRPDLMTLHYEATIDDPGAYTRPWTIAFDLSWNPNGEIMEYICQENNLWLKRLLKQVPE